MPLKPSPLRYLPAILIVGLGAIGVIVLLAAMLAPTIRRSWQARRRR